MSSIRNLANAVAAEAANGYRVQSQSEDQVILVKGKKTSHGLHLVLTVITFGLWLPVWGVMAVLNREQRLVLSVDTIGNVSRSAL